jgi:uncharacterized protein GlcG (DUF336 family)
MITAEQARAAIDAIVAATAAQGHVVTVAVVDDHGDLIAAHRMDGCRPRHMHMTIRKAYTAAVMDRDTTAFHDDIVRRQLQIVSYGDPMLCALQGGVVVRDEAGTTLGGVGVTGSIKGGDIELATMALPFFQT